VRLAGLLFESGNTEESERLYREAVQQNSGLATAQLGLGRVLAARGDWAGAIERYLRACEISEDFVAAHYALGMAYRKTGEMEKAREHLQRSLQAKQKPQPSEDPLMGAVKSLYSGGLSLFATGSSLAEQGKPREAVAKFESALQANPNLVMAHVNLIAMFGQLGLLDKAERHFQQAVRLDPGWVEAYYNWGLCLLQRGRRAEAAGTFRKAVALNPNYADAHAQLGLLLEEEGQGSEAQRHYRLALESDPAHRQAHYLTALSLMRGGKFAEAIPHLRETIQVEDSRTPACMQALGVAYARTGEGALAAHYLAEAKQRAVSLKMDSLASQIQGDLERLSSGGKP
jgi:tetratricopeptide (TPR) repeat protein